MSNNNRISRRRVLGGIATVGAASAAAGAGTWAYFSDTESSSGNTVSAGTLNLTPDGVSGLSHNVTDLAPGGTVGPVSIDLVNSGTISGDHLEFDVSASQNDGTEPNDAELDNGGAIGVFGYALNLHVTTLSYGSASYGSGISQSELPGAFINSNSSPPSGGPSESIHVTSNGQSVEDYNLATIDVSGSAMTLNDLDNATFEYQWYARSGNTANVPDEVFLTLSDGTTLYRNRSSSTTGSWVTQDLSSEINQSNWTNLATGNSVNPVSDFGSSVVSSVAIGIGDFENTNTGNSGHKRVFDVFVGPLNYGGTTMTWPDQANPNLQDLLEDGTVTLDNLDAPGGGATFTIEYMLDPAVGNGYQGDGIDLTYRFGLAQNSSQDIL